MCRRRSTFGFSLIELMVVVAIVAILAAIGYPSYQDSVRKARRSDAKTAIAQAAALQEKWYFQQNQYSTDVTKVGGGSSPENFYTMAVDTSPCGNTTCFRMIATATGAQTSDGDCLVFTLNSNGVKDSFSDSLDGTSSKSICWR